VTILRAITFGLVAAAFIATPARAQTLYDGLWNVTVLTRAGSCERSSQYPLAVKDGKILGSPDISGSVGPSGSVKVSIRGAYANGQLNGNGGSGRWNGASSGVPCSGRWDASRQ
jgi:hypothetical protein